MHNNKVVFVLLDGLQSEYAREHLGYLEHLCEHKKAAKYEVLGELPSASRPMYETIFTGLPVYELQIIIYVDYLIKSIYLNYLNRIIKKV